MPVLVIAVVFFAIFLVMGVMGVTAMVSEHKGKLFSGQWERLPKGEADLASSRPVEESDFADPGPFGHAVAAPYRAVSNTRDRHGSQYPLSFRSIHSTA